MELDLECVSEGCSKNFMLMPEKGPSTTCFVCRRTSFLKKGAQRYERCPSVVPSEGLLKFLCLSLPFAAKLRLHNHCSVERVYKSILYKDGFFRKDVVELQKIFQSTKTHTTQELSSEVIVPQDDGVIFLSDLFQKCATIDEGVVALRDYKDNPYKFQYLPVSSVSKLGEEGEKMYLEQCKKVQYDIFKLQMQLGKFKRRGELIIENTSSAKSSHSYIFRHDEKDRFSNEGGDLTSGIHQMHEYKNSTKRLKVGIAKTVASNHKVSLAGDLSK